MKYSSTVRPSMKLALIGRSMISPFGLAMRPRMPASWRICLNEPRAPELAIMKMGLSSCEVLLHRLADLVRGRVPAVGDRLVALLLGDEPRVVLVEDLADLALVALEDLVLGRRDHHVVLRDGDAGLAREVEAELLERVEHLRGDVRAVLLHEALDHGAHVALAQRLVHERVARRRVVLVAEHLLERTLHALVEDDPADRGQDVALAVQAPVLGEVVQLDHVVLVGELGLLRRAEHVRAIAPS